MPPTFDTLDPWTLSASVLQVMAALLVVMFACDRMQRADAIRRNYRVIGWFRGLFTRLGEYFRQYFFATDREELPFKPAQRNRVVRAAEGRGNTVAFGSTRNTAVPGTPIFANTPYPPLAGAARAGALTIGPGARPPYAAPSRPAMEALSHGAAGAGMWLNTGEGGVSPCHLVGGCDIVFQIGTENYDVRTPDGALCDDRLRAVAAHEQVRMFEIRRARAASPARVASFPGAKITPAIAAVRGTPAGGTAARPTAGRMWTAMRRCWT